MEHLSAKQVWVQGAIKIHEIDVAKIPRGINSADLSTHGCTTADFNDRLERLFLKRPRPSYPLYSLQIKVDEAEPREEAETAENEEEEEVDEAEPREEAETAENVEEENACFYRLKKAKQRHDKFPRLVAGGIPARVPAESEAAQGSLLALRDEQNSLDRPLEAYPPGSLPKVWLSGEIWRLDGGESRGGVLKEDTPKGPKITVPLGPMNSISGNYDFVENDHHLPSDERMTHEDQLGEAIIMPLKVNRFMDHQIGKRHHGDRLPSYHSERVIVIYHFNFYMTVGAGSRMRLAKAVLRTRARVRARARARTRTRARARACARARTRTHTRTL
jgi:hypothetical protein